MQSAPPSLRAGRFACAAIVAALAGLGIGGCGGSGDSTITGTPTQNISPPDLPDVPTVAGAVGARGDVEMGACSVTPGKVVVNGTVTNPTAKPVDYAVTISWINATYDVRARGSAVVKDVAPRKSAKWSVTVDLTADNATECTVFAERGRVTG